MDFNMALTVGKTIAIPVANAMVKKDDEEYINKIALNLANIMMQISGEGKK